MNKKKKGYTLVEIMVVVASVGLIMTALVGVVIGTFRAQNRNAAINKVSENGTWIINELRKNTFNSFRDSVICLDDGLSVQVKNLQDGGITTLSCDEVTNQIASTSADKQDILNTKEINSIDCFNFAVCDSVSGDRVTNITFNFGLEAIVNGVSARQNFTTKVTLRN